MPDYSSIEEIMGLGISLFPSYRPMIALELVGKTQYRTQIYLYIAPPYKIRKALKQLHAEKKLSHKELREMTNDVKSLEDILKARNLH